MLSWNILWFQKDFNDIVMDEIKKKIRELAGVQVIMRLQKALQFNTNDAYQRILMTHLTQIKKGCYVSLFNIFMCYF